MFMDMTSEIGYNTDIRMVTTRRAGGTPGADTVQHQPAQPPGLQQRGGYLKYSISQTRTYETGPKLRVLNAAPPPRESAL